MRTFKTDRDQLILLVIRISTMLILFLMLLSELNVTAQSIPSENGIRQGKSLQAKVRQIYMSQIGVREKPSNSGPQVEKYLKYVDLPKGNPWCAAFVCWVLGEAGLENPRSGWSPALFGVRHVIWDWKQRTRNKEPRTKSQEPGLGDVFGIYFPEKGRIAHVGFVDHWDGTWMISVEGNTNMAGSREGDGVYRKMRLVSSLHKVSRYIPY
jgi:hypothetical protein